MSIRDKDAEEIGNIVEKTISEWHSSMPNRDGDHLQITDYIHSKDEVEHLIDEVAGDVCDAVDVLLKRREKEMIEKCKQAVLDGCGKDCDGYAMIEYRINWSRP